MRFLIIIALTAFVYMENQKVLERSNKKKTDASQTAKNQLPSLPALESIGDPSIQAEPFDPERELAGLPEEPSANPN